MHNLISYNQLADWKQSVKHLEETLDHCNAESDLINDYYNCLIECDDNQHTCKKICKEVFTQHVPKKITKSTPKKGAFLLNSNVVTGTNPQVFPCTGNRTYRGSRMSVATSGWYGKNYGMQIRIVKRQKMQGKNGVSVLLNMGK